MICPICKEVIKDESKFCGKCGSMIPRCPTCGRVITKKSKFCTSDGTPLPEDIIALFETVSDETKQEKNVRKKKKGLFSLPTAFFVIAFFGILITAGYSCLYDEYPWETILSFIDQREKKDTLDAQKRKEGQKQETIWTSTSEAEEQEEILIEEVPPTETETESFAMESSETEISLETEEEMPSAFDEFSVQADRDYSDCTETAKRNAAYLENMMITYGFKAYFGEWWHFSDSDDYPVEEEYIP